MYYFLSALLFPQDLDEYKGYQDYFLSRRRWFFGFAALTESLDVIDTLIKGEAHLRSLGTGVSRCDRCIRAAVRGSRANAQPEIPHAVCAQRGGL
jgi:hypothetical protein